MTNVNVTELHCIIMELLENIETIDDTFFVENVIIKYIGNICDKKREEIYSNK